MKLRMCNCRYCKMGRKHTGWRKRIRRLRSDARSVVRRRLRAGELYDFPAAIGVPYTD